MKRATAELHKLTRAMTDLPSAPTHGSRFVEVECCARKLIYQRGNFLHRARGTRQGIKGLKAAQRKKDRNDLIEGFARREGVLLNEPPCDDAHPVPSPFIPCSYHLLKIRVESG